MATGDVATPPRSFCVGRRRFLATSSAVLATGLLGADGAEVAAKPRRVGLIGAGWYGKSDLWRLVQVAPVEIVALADPDRRMLEGEAILATARRLGRVVQVGTQRKSTPHLVEAKRRVIDEGLLGEVAHVDLCCYFQMRANGDPPVEPVPEFLDYGMWTGPAPLRPYDGLPHRRWWRTFMEYGNGIVGDMGVHMLDTARWMLGLGWPRSVASWGGILVQHGGKSTIPDTQTAVFDYGPLQCVWQHRTWGVPPDPDYPWALFIHGDKGVLKASTMKAEFIPKGKGDPIRFECVFEKERFPEDVTEKDIELNAAPATRRHMLDFLAAIDRRGRPVADIEDGHISSASCILANVALQLGRPVAYDPVSRTVPGDAEATALLARRYREPWTRPAV